MPISAVEPNLKQIVEKENILKKIMQEGRGGGGGGAGNSINYFKCPLKLNLVARSLSTNQYLNF